MAQQSWIFTTMRTCISRTLWEKEENSGNQHFLLFPQCLLLFYRDKACHVHLHFRCWRKLNCNWTNLNIVIWFKRYIDVYFAKTSVMTREESSGVINL